MGKRLGVTGDSSWVLCMEGKEGLLAAWEVPQWFRALDFTLQWGLATSLAISLADVPAPGPKGELDTSHPLLSIV